MRPSGLFSIVTKSNENRNEKVTEEKEKRTKREKELNKNLLFSSENLSNLNISDQEKEQFLNKNNSESDTEILKKDELLIRAREENNESVTETVTKNNGKNKNAVTEKPKLTPDQPEYWQRAFGKNAEMARRFSEVSGVPIVNSRISLWQKNLKDFNEAGITIEQMEAAVMRYRKEMPDVPIKSPGSVLSFALDLPTMRPRTEPEREDIMDVAKRLQRQRDMKMLETVS